MTSVYSPWWKRKILYKIPLLFKKCLAGNYHWFWHEWCECGNQHGDGIYHFPTKSFEEK